MQAGRQAGRQVSHRPTCHMQGEQQAATHLPFYSVAWFCMKAFAHHWSVLLSECPQQPHHLCKFDERLLKQLLASQVRDAEIICDVQDTAAATPALDNAFCELEV